MSGKNRKILFLILAFAFCVRAAYFLTLEQEPVFPDSESYDRIAADLLEGRGYTSTSRPPLYPVLLAGVYRVFGRDFFAVRLLQAAVDCLSAAAVFLLGRRVFSERAGLLAAGAFAAYPFFIFFSGLILTETIFIFLLLLFICLLRKNSDEPSPSRAALCGGTAGLCVLVKPAMFLFIPAAIIWLMPAEKRRKTRLANAGLLAACALAVTAPWGIYNFVKHGSPALLTTGGGITLYESFNPLADGGPGQELIERTPEAEEMDAFRRDAHYRARALEFIRENPGRAFSLALSKQKRFWSPVPNEPAYRKPGCMALSIVSYAPVLVLALWQAFSGKKRWREISFLCLPVIYFALLHTVILGSLRYRIPVDPFLIILAAGKISGLRRGRF